MKYVTLDVRPRILSKSCPLKGCQYHRSHRMGRRAFQARNAERSGPALDAVKAAALSGGNIFEALMEATKVCTLTDISGALYAVGGQYRRNM